ncbi:YkyA family protein [Neobacillus muris]|uniref:YkyA family protein n=1 Tax=Neobacillus muris TaxID=2941334 RepID=UPI00203BC044|nr:YkyA family protein [Neobacillus muris]
MSGGKNLFILFIFIIIFVNAGCSHQQTPTKEMYDVLEEAASKEKTFEEQQEPLTELEGKEKELYQQIISLGMKEYSQISKLSDEAVSSAEKRKELFEKETKSIKESEKTFKKGSSIKGRIDDPGLKKSADHLYGTMTERYRAHESLYKAYMESIKNDIHLYKMFKNKDVPVDELENQVEKANKSYNEVYTANEKFNKLTKDFNKEKLSFYKQAGLQKNH